MDTALQKVLVQYLVYIAFRKLLHDTWFILKLKQKDGHKHEAHDGRVNVIHQLFVFCISSQSSSSDQTVQHLDLCLHRFILIFEKCNIRSELIMLSLMNLITTFNFQFQVLKLLLMSQCTFLQTNLALEHVFKSIHDRLSKSVSNEFEVSIFLISFSRRVLLLITYLLRRQRSTCLACFFRGNLFTFEEWVIDSFL